jgi:hypothetical protein
VSAGCSTVWAYFRMLNRWVGPLFFMLAAGASCGEHHYTIGDNRAGADTIAEPVAGSQSGGSGTAGGSGGAAAQPSMAGSDTDGAAAGDGFGDGGSGDLGCPEACTHGCVGRLCEISPLVDGSLPACPAGFDCVVHCEEPGTCLGEVHCADARTCIVNCTAEKNCYGAIHCDNTGDCQVICSGTEACGKVSCPTSGRCAVTCNGTDSCSSDVVCGAGPCSVLCGGAASCGGTLGCEGSCACDWQCAPGSHCQSNLPTCPDGCASGVGCSSASTGCRTCN